MEPDDLLCSRNARPQKDGRGTARPSFLLAEAARSECAPSMRAVKDSLAVPLERMGENRKGLVRRAEWDQAWEALPAGRGKDGWQFSIQTLSGVVQSSLL
jgi:hypothetical protein